MAGKADMRQAKKNRLSKEIRLCIGLLFLLGTTLLFFMANAHAQEIQNQVEIKFNPEVNYVNVTSDHDGRTTFSGELTYIFNWTAQSEPVPINLKAESISGFEISVWPLVIWETHLIPQDIGITVIVPPQTVAGTYISMITATMTVDHQEYYGYSNVSVVVIPYHGLNLYNSVYLPLLFMTPGGTITQTFNLSNKGNIIETVDIYINDPSGALKQTGRTYYTTLTVLPNSTNQFPLILKLSDNIDSTFAQEIWVSIEAKSTTYLDARDDGHPKTNLQLFYQSWWDEKNTYEQVGIILLIAFGIISGGAAVVYLIRKRSRNALRNNKPVSKPSLNET
jgi:hypothetical protein